MTDGPNFIGLMVFVGLVAGAILTLLIGYDWGLLAVLVGLALLVLVLMCALALSGDLDE